jgi:hypothetical protein
VFGVDKWFAEPLLGQATFHALGLVDGGSRERPWVGVDPDARPGLDDVVAVRDEQSAQLRAFLDGISDGDLDRAVEVLDAGTVPMSECMYTVFEESFEHHRYAVRDLAQLEAEPTA